MTTFSPYFHRLLVQRVLSPSVLAAMSLTTVAIATSSNVQAGEMYVYKDANGQVLLTNVSPSGNFEKFTKKVKVTYYPDSKIYNGATTSANYGSSAPSSSRNRSAYDGLILSSAARHGVDPALMKAMMHTESAFNPNARSPVGAQGLMQLMPATARRFSVGNPWNPAENIEGSAKYIAWLMRRFNNNVEYAVAGYNAGEGNVEKYGGIPPFRETRNYVKQVMSRYHSLYKNDSGLLGGIRSASADDMSIQPVSYSSNGNTTGGGYASIGYGSSASYANSAYAALR